MNAPTITGLLRLGAMVAWRIRAALKEVAYET